MKRLFRAAAMCFSMFCAIPCPYQKWDEDARPFVTLFLPLLGLFIGLLWTLLRFVCQFLMGWGLPPLVSGLCLTAYPFLVTGGIHFDGFLDVTDAVKSYRPLEKRREILKDPNVGSFAVLGGGLLLLALFASFGAECTANCQMTFKDLLRPAFGLTLIPVVSRALAGLCVTVLRPLSVSEYAGAYRQKIKKSHVLVLVITLCASVGLGFLLLGRYGWASAGVLAGFGLALRRGFRSLDGMSGDVSGYALTVGELCGVAVLTLLSAWGGGC